jgi:hypothetical protein
MLFHYDRETLEFTCDDTTTYSNIILPVGRQTDDSKHLTFPLAPALPMKIEACI